MRRRLPTLTAGTALVLVALLATAGVAAHRLRDGRPSSSRAKPVVEITGKLTRPLRPGMTQKLNLRLRNRSRRTVLVTKLTIALKVDRAHMRLGCSRARSFRVSRLRKRDYPLELRGRARRSLRALRVTRVPRVRMIDLRTNQDACKGARLTLRYRAETRPYRATKRSSRRSTR